MSADTITAFAGSTLVASGTKADVTVRLRELEAAQDQRTILIFDDATGQQIDVDVRELPAAEKPESEPEPEPRRPGRPKLGVVAREVTLLPRHWEWLSAQPGGASVALRKLVEHARRTSALGDGVRRSREASFRFMTAMAGNEPGYEEAARALYAGDRGRFEELIGRWPEDVVAYTSRLAAGAFSDCVQ